MLIKILVICVAGYLAYRVLTKPRQIEGFDNLVPEEDEFVEYEEVED